MASVLVSQDAIEGCRGVIGGVLFGAFATGIIPGETAGTYWGLAPLETWILAAVLYIAGVAIVRAISREARRPASEISCSARSSALSIPLGILFAFMALEVVEVDLRDVFDHMGAHLFPPDLQ